MAGEIRRCARWQSAHNRPQYTLTSTCPSCGSETEPATPARYVPGDPYGRYRRATKQRGGEDGWSG